MVQSLKSQLAHALVKRPEVYSMEDTREQLMTRLNDVTAFAEQESKRAECLLREKEEIVKQYESDVSKKDQIIVRMQSLNWPRLGKRHKKNDARWTRSRKRLSSGSRRLKGCTIEYLEEMHKLHEQLKNREAMLKQEESFFISSMRIMRNSEHSRGWRYWRPRTRKMNIVNKEQ